MIDVTDIIVYQNAHSLRWPGGRVVAVAKPCTSVQFRSGPPSYAFFSYLRPRATILQTWVGYDKLANKNLEHRPGFISSQPPRRHYLVPFCRELPDVHYRHRLGSNIMRKRPAWNNWPDGLYFGRYLTGAGVIIPLALYEARSKLASSAEER